ncbi:MAG: hypothetical protein EOO60_13375 [Hymenobacter sp.]|nr:MAG: hypothetical protein EOO60_13375 [Hymenobacter sp.]
MLQDLQQSRAQQLPSGPEMLQLGINYRHNSLSQHQTLAPLPLQAGDRAPDAPIQDSEGKSVRLFDMFRGPHFTLLSLGNADGAKVQQLGARHPNIQAYSIAPSPASSDHTMLVDIHGHVRRAYGEVAGTLFLIRPDGYIGFIGEHGHVEAVDQYMKQFEKA